MPADTNEYDWDFEDAGPFDPMEESFDEDYDAGLFDPDEKA